MMNDKAPEFWIKKPDKIVVNVKEVPVETKQIIYSLRDKACRANYPSWTKILNKAADRPTELDKPRKTGRWIIRITSDDILAECSECRVCGNPNWNVCPVCEARMVNDNRKEKANAD